MIVENILDWHPNAQSELVKEWTPGPLEAPGGQCAKWWSNVVDNQHHGRRR